MAQNGGFGELDNGYAHLRTIRVKSDPAANDWVDGACRIVIPASPPGVYPAVEFQDGDLRIKSSMVT